MAKFLSRRELIIGSGCGLAYSLLFSNKFKYFFSHISLPNQLEIVSAFKSSASKLELYPIIGFRPSGNLLSPVHGDVLSWRPHAFMSIGRNLVALAKGNKMGAILDRQTLRVQNEFSAPHGTHFYGHGLRLEDKSNNASRFLLSAFSPVDGRSEIYARNGYLLEYELGADNQLKLIAQHHTEGFIPHHFAYNTNRTEIAYTSKFNAQEKSHIAICGAKDFKVRRLIPVGITDKKNRVDRAAHILAVESGYYYSFTEFSGTEDVGGGIGYSSIGGSENWEVSYTELISKNKLKGNSSSLDIVMLKNGPAVVQNGLQTLMALNLKSMKFNAIQAKGLTGVATYGENNDTLLSLTGGVGKLFDKENIQSITANVNDELVPVSHLFLSINNQITTL